MNEVGEWLDSLKRKFETGIQVLRIPGLTPTPAPTPVPAVPKPAQPKSTKALTLLFIGETGAGKTTLINTFYFFAQNKPLSQLEALVNTKFLAGKTAGSESNTSNQNQTQTTKAEVYTFLLPTKTTTYDIKIMDTPGLGDTRGIVQDDKNITEIVRTVERTPELNAVFLILNGAQARLTSHVSYVIQKLKGMLPNVFRDNLFLILTNSPIKANLGLDKDTLDVPADRQFGIDNSIFSLDINAASDYQKRLLENSWMLLKDNIAYILQKAGQLKGVKTDAFQVIRENRDLVQLKISILQAKTKDLANEKAALQEYEAKIKVLAAGSATLKQVQAQSIRNVTEVTYASTSYHNTICRACDYTKHAHPQCCHENCGLDFNSVQGDNIFKSCHAIAGEKCVGSPNCGHLYSYHVHVRQKPVVTSRQVNYFTPEQLVELNELTSDEAVKKSLLANTKAQLVKVEAEKQLVEQELVKCFQELRNVCSDFNYKREVDLSIELVDARIQTVQQSNDTKELYELQEVMETLKGVLSTLSRIFQKMQQ